MRILTAFAIIATTLYSQVPSAAREQALGREMARDVERRERFVEDPQVVDYVTTVVRKLAKPCQAADVSVRVIESDAINGSVLPGQQLYVTSGLLRFVENESELAGVLAHLIRRVPVPGGQVAVPAGLVFITSPNGDSFLPTPDTPIPRNLESQVDAAVSAADGKAMQCMDSAGYDPVGLIMVLSRLPKIPVERMEHVAETIMALEPSSAFLLNTAKFVELRRHIASSQAPQRVPSLRN